MAQEILDPLDEYANVFRDRFKKVAEETFAEIAAEAHVDVEANRKTCREIYGVEDNLKEKKSQIDKWRALSALLWILCVGGIICCFCIPETLGSIGVVFTAIGAAASAIYNLAEIKANIKNLKKERDGIQEQIDKLKEEAWAQMEPMNHLFDWDVLTRMMTKTLPIIEFDPYFTTQRLADLKAVYNWDDCFNEGRSVIYSHSGLINGNPFVLCRTRKMEWAKKVYTGYKTISWTTTVRGADGKNHTVHRSQTLTAEVEAPVPTYPEKTRLIYGCTAAPDLIFNRQKSGMASKIGSLSFKWQRAGLRRKARDMEKSNFAMMSNEEFEVAFNTSDRNDNHQHALLFTPLAQDNILKLLQDTEIGYGDDFDFLKNKMINTIISDHIQGLDLNMNPSQYRNFDYDKAQEDFYSINANYFRAIYFCLAPLLSIPIYQQVRPQEAIYGTDMPRRSAFWEHESLANFWGASKFKHPDCVTKCILKTEQTASQGNHSNIKVYAYGYRVKDRVTYVEKFGGDGRIHKVAVNWKEYLPVTGTGNIDMVEDPEYNDTAVTSSERTGHINQLLGGTNLSVYRRHIASACR